MSRIRDTAGIDVHRGGEPGRWRRVEATAAPERVMVDSSGTPWWSTPHDHRRGVPVVAAGRWKRGVAAQYDRRRGRSWWRTGWVTVVDDKRRKIAVTVLSLFLIPLALNVPGWYMQGQSYNVVRTVIVFGALVGFLVVLLLIEAISNHFHRHLSVVLGGCGFAVIGLGLAFVRLPGSVGAFGRDLCSIVAPVV